MEPQAENRRTRRRWFEPVQAAAGTEAPAALVLAHHKLATSTSYNNSTWSSQQSPAPWPMPPPQPAEHQNCQPCAAQNPRHTRQVSVRPSTAGVLDGRSTATCSSVSSGANDAAARQPLAATQAQLCNKVKDVEAPQCAADLKPQPPATARIHKHNPRPAKGISSDVASKPDTARQQCDQDASKQQHTPACQRVKSEVRAPERCSNHTAASLARACSTTTPAISARPAAPRQPPAGTSRPRAPSARPLSCSSTAAGGRAIHGRAALVRSTRIVPAGARALSVAAEGSSTSSSIGRVHPTTPLRSTTRPTLRSPGSSNSSRSHKQHLVCALKVLRQQQQQQQEKPVLEQQQQQQQEEQQALAAVECPSSTACNTSVQQLRQAKDKAAVAAAAALEDVLLLARAVELADHFHELQQRAATAAPAQQVGCVDDFTALSSSLQQLLAKRQRQQQQQQLQHSPDTRSTPGRAPPAAGAQAASPLWCSVTTNALFDSTPASATAAVSSGTPPVGKAGSSRLSPLKANGQAAAAAGSSSSTADYWGLGVDLQPLRGSLSAVRASQQHKLAPSQAMHTQQQCAAGQLLRQLQDEMQQWFVGYVGQHLCKAQVPVNTRGDCIELLKALTHAQQWIQQQEQQESGAITQSAHMLAPAAAAPSDAAVAAQLPADEESRRICGSRALSNGPGPALIAEVAAAAGSTTPPPAAATGSLSPATAKHGRSPGSQLQHLQVSLRKSLCHVGFMRFQLPA